MLRLYLINSMTNIYKYLINTLISNLKHTTRFWNNLHQVRIQRRKIGKSNKSVLEQENERAYTE